MGATDFLASALLKDRNFVPDVRILCYANVNEYKESGADHEQLLEIINKWKSIGFCEGLDEETTEFCAFAYEQGAIFLLSEDKSGHFEPEQRELYEVVFFPLLRKVITGLDNIDNFDFNKFITITTACSIEYPKGESMSKIDKECYFVNEVAKTVIEKLMEEKTQEEKQ